MFRKKETQKNYLDEIKEVYDFMVKNNLDAIELSDKNNYIKLVRKTAKEEKISIISAQNISPQNTIQATTSSKIDLQPEVKGPSIKAPMSGIFYRASSPSSPPYVREGDVIEANTVVCIIEAMKVFNEVKAEFKCKIVKCIAENGKFVNEGDILFIIEKL